MSFKRFKKNTKGFTLLELMVSASIIAIISTLVISDYRRGGQRADLVMEAQKLASNIKLAQTYALSAKNDKIYGWGVFFDRNRNDYVVYFDEAPGDKVCHANCGDGSNEDFLRVVLPGNIEILDTFTDGDSFGRLQYHFLPPDPEVSIYRTNSGTSYATGQIVLQNATNGDSIKINLNKFGLVDIEK